MNWILFLLAIDSSQALKVDGYKIQEYATLQDCQATILKSAVKFSWASNSLVCLPAKPTGAAGRITNEKQSDWKPI